MPRVTPSSRPDLRRWWPVLAAAVAVTFALGTKLQAQEVVYLFYMRKDLAHLIQNESEKVVGKKVVVTDELTVIWPEVQRKTDLNGTGHVLFDTTYFQCAVPSSNMGPHLESIWDDAQRGYREATKKIEAVNEQERTREISATQANDMRRELYWELYRVWSNKPVVTIFGLVDRAEFWGPVKGQEAGVDTESVSIVVDRVEKPRARWYKSLDE